MSDGYLTCAETAKLVRGALKRAFPGVKFSVRSSTYSMGASINVHWTDGPTTEQVRGVTSPYEGSGFDGMIDLKYSCQSWLMPDGSAAWAHSAGTSGSMGVHGPYDCEKPHPDAVLVQFCADSVSLNRRYSEDFAGQIRDFLATRYAHIMQDFPTVRVDDGYGSRLDGSHASANVPLWSNGGSTYPSDVFYRLASRVSADDVGNLDAIVYDLAGV
jgi:hypothetical protein